MCDETRAWQSHKTIPVSEAVGAILVHDITEIRPGEFKGRAFRRGHIVRPEDVCHLKRLGKERLFVLDIPKDEMHEDDAAMVVGEALAGRGAFAEGPPKEGKINIVAGMDGLLKVDKDALLKFNTSGDVMCATLHDNTVVKSGMTIGAARAIPLTVKRDAVMGAVKAAGEAGVLSVREMRMPVAGVVVTGNEVYYGRVKDGFSDIIKGKVESFGGTVIDTLYAPDEEEAIASCLRDLLRAGADLLVTTGGMSVDPDDVTRFAIKSLGGDEISYGTAALPGSMTLVAWIGDVPVIGVPACGLYHKATAFDLILPRVLAGDRVGRFELAALGHGGLCLGCEECRFPNCPFGKQ